MRPLTRFAGRRRSRSILEAQSRAYVSEQIIFFIFRRDLDQAAPTTGKIADAKDRLAVRGVGIHPASPQINLEHSKSRCVFPHVSMPGACLPTKIDGAPREGSQTAFQIIPRRLLRCDELGVTHAAELRRPRAGQPRVQPARE